MIVFLVICYAAVLAVLVALKVLPNSVYTWLSVLVWNLLLLILLFIPMQWGAPAGPVRVYTYTVQIIPNVSGPVTTVPVQTNVPLKQGDVLFTIDPTTFQSTVDSTQAQLDFQKLRLEQYEKLASTAAGTRFQVEETQALVKQLEAELENAKWNLQETTVRAPSEGFVTTVGLRPGQRVTSIPLQPAMTFVDTSRTFFGVQIQQIYMRHVEVGQKVEMTFKTHPGRIYTGKVAAIIEATHASQVLTGGTILQAGPITAEPFAVRIELDDEDAGKALMPGSAGSAAIFTGSATMTHVIRKVMLRMQGFANYILP